MGLREFLSGLFGPSMPAESPHQETAEILKEVDASRKQRVKADRVIRAISERTEEALGDYRPGLLDPLNEARDRLGMPPTREHRR